MRAVIQRVKGSSVKVHQNIIGEIGRGLNVLVGISVDDNLEDIKYIVEKLVNLRIFQDNNEKLNLSLLDVKGELLIISQFTLYGDCRKGRRPSFIDALGGEEAKTLYIEFLNECRRYIPELKSGEFGADMEVTIINDGPVTLILDSKDKRR